MKNGVLFEVITKIVGGEWVLQYEDALQIDSIRSIVLEEVRAKNETDLCSGTNHLVVKGWQEGKYYPYPLLFWSLSERERAAEHFRQRDGGDLPYVPSNMEVSDRIQEIEDAILMMEQMNGDDVVINLRAANADFDGDYQTGILED